MENARKEEEIDSSSTVTFKIPGEPTIVIDGVPSISSSVRLSLSNSLSGVESNGAETNASVDFGEWLEGKGSAKVV